MNRLIAVAASFVVAGAVLGAHGGNEHVRGVVTQISAQSITVQTSDKASQTLAITDKTTVKQAGKPAVRVADVHVGDRVVIDVPEKTTNALLIQIGAPAKAAAHK